jgi:hypothetical protein
MANIALGNTRGRDEGSWIAVGQKKPGVEMKPKKSSPENSFGSHHSSRSDSYEMGSNSSTSTSNTPCKFYQLGQCAKGSKCPFLHKKTSSSNQICKFYAGGFCRNGDRCPFLHVKPIDDLSDEVESEDQNLNLSANEHSLGETTSGSSSSFENTTVSPPNPKSQFQSPPNPTSFAGKESSPYASREFNSPPNKINMPNGTSSSMNGRHPHQASSAGSHPAPLEIEEDDEDLDILITKSIDMGMDDDDDDSSYEEEEYGKSAYPTSSAVAMAQRSRANSLQHNSGSFDFLFLKSASPLSHSTFFEDVFTSRSGEHPIWKNQAGSVTQPPTGNLIAGNTSNTHTGHSGFNLPLKSPIFNNTSTGSGQSPRLSGLNSPRENPRPGHTASPFNGTVNQTAAVAPHGLAKAHRSDSSSSLFSENDPAFALLSPTTRVINPPITNVPSGSGQGQLNGEEEFDPMFQVPYDHPTDENQPESFTEEDLVITPRNGESHVVSANRPIMNFLHQPVSVPSSLTSPYGSSLPKHGTISPSNHMGTSVNKIVFVETAVNSNKFGPNMNGSPVEHQVEPYDQPFEDISPPFYSGSLSQSMKLSESPPGKKGKTLCTFHIDGKCRYGDTCRNIHGDVCDMCGRPCLIPGDTAQNEKHIASCEEKLQRQRDIETSRDYECGLCNEKIIENGRKFGLLVTCNHIYCVPCIKQWRQDNQSSECPHPKCSAVSTYIVPSPTYVSEGLKKNSLVASYREKMTKIPCKYFDFGKGTCKFGDNCHYAHVDANGRPVSMPQRTFIDSSGEFQHYGEIKLAMFLENQLDKKKSNNE